MTSVARFNLPAIYEQDFGTGAGGISLHGQSAGRNS
jgi:hypothetical protein